MRAGTDISLTGRLFFCSHCIIVSLLDEWAACPAPEPVLQMSVRARTSHRRTALHRHFHLAAIKTRPKQFEPQKTSLFFPSCGSFTKGCFVFHSHRGDDERADVVSLASPSLLSPVSLFDIVWPFQFCVKDRNETSIELEIGAPNTQKTTANNGGWGNMSV